MADSTTMNAAKLARAASESGYSVANGAQFLAWWKSHLWQALPESLRATVIKNARPFTIAPSQDRLWSERSDWSKSLKISQTTLLSGDPSKLRPAALLVGEESGLRRVVDFPLAVEARLDQVLAYELDRLTPLRAQDLYYDYRVVGRIAARNSCSVELTAAPKARIDEAVAQAKNIGAAVTRVALTPSDIDHGLDLLRAQSSASTREKDALRWVTPALIALCVLLALAVVFYPIYEKRAHVIALLPIEAQARTDAEAASVVQRQLERQVTEYNHVLKRKHASPIAVQVLDDLGKRLPDDTWAQTFEIKVVAGAAPAAHVREVIVQGETGSGGKLLQLVQESTMIKDPVLKAAMTRVSPTAERFHFAGELIAVAPPSGLSLADANSVLGTPVQVTPNAAAGTPALAREPAAASEKAPEKATEKKVNESAKSSDAAKESGKESSKETPKPSAPSSEKPLPVTPNSGGAMADPIKKSSLDLNGHQAQNARALRAEASLPTVGGGA
jgi:general secretion pathway protein L